MMYLATFVLTDYNTCMTAGAVDLLGCMLGRAATGRRGLG